MKVPRSKLLFMVVSVVVLAFGVAACGGDSESSGSAEPGSMKAEEVTLGYVPPASENPIIQALIGGLEQKTEALGMTYKQYAGQFDTEAQIQGVRAALADGVDALSILPIDPKGIQPTLDEVRDADVPLIVNLTPEVKPFLTNFELNDEEAGYQVAQYVAETLKKENRECKVGIIEGIPTVPLHVKRNAGMASGAEDAGCEVLDKQVNKDDTAGGARPIAAGWATKYGSEMTGVLAYNDPSALGVTSVVSSDFSPQVSGFNGDPEGVKAVEQGRILVTMFEPVVLIGNGIAQSAYDNLVEGTEVPEEIWAEYELLDKETLKTFTRLEQQLASPMDVSWKDEGGKYIIRGSNE